MHCLHSRLCQRSMLSYQHLAANSTFSAASTARPIRGLAKQVEKDGERHCPQLAHLYGALQCQAEIEQIVALANTPLLKANCVCQAMQGSATSIAEE